MRHMITHLLFTAGNNVLQRQKKVLMAIKKEIRESVRVCLQYQTN